MRHKKEQNVLPIGALAAKRLPVLEKLPSNPGVRPRGRPEAQRIGAELAAPERFR